jgi:hypothetical protein
MSGAFNIHVKKMRNACRVLSRKPKGKKPFGNLNVDGQMILK